MGLDEDDLDRDLINKQYVTIHIKLGFIIINLLFGTLALSVMFMMAALFQQYCSAYSKVIV